MTATATLDPRPTRVIPWSRLGDEALAGRAANGNDAAFTALYQRYYGPLLGYTSSILRDAEDARDATQNALENALRALPQRDKSRPLRPWLYKIAHNEAITIMRRRRPQTELAPELEPIVPGPEVDAEQRVRLAQLVDDLQSLPERQRGALVMRELNGLSYEEIGVALGLTNEAARRAVFDARNALHAAADGRATECVSVRRSISDGDRRSLRARGIRAHLRSCNDCASFQRSIGSRRADLHVLAPWASGAAVVGAIGIGAGSLGGAGALTASGTGAVTGAGGAGGLWASMPAVAKGLAVAAAVATTGTAAVEIKHAAEPSRPATTGSHVARAPSSRADALALRAAADAAAAAKRTRAHVAARSQRIRTSKATTTSSTGSAATTKRHDETPSLLPPAPAVKAQPTPAAVQPAPPPPAAPAAPAAPKTPAEQAVSKLDRLGDQVKQVLADAKAVAADGTQEALALASGLLQRTLGPLVTQINRVLSSVGLGPMAAPAAPAPAAQTTTAPSILAPVQGVLDGVKSLLQRLLGQR